jgi:hypothetical protein
MSSVFTSIQRWIYVESNSLPNALRELANAIEAAAASVPEDENSVLDIPSDSIVEVQHDQNDGTFIAGCLVSWKSATEGETNEREES